jgi:Cell wall-associated hydrolases (invasion-associated proteins)
MILKKIAYLTLCLVLFTLSFSHSAIAQQGNGVVKATSSRPVNQPQSALQNPVPVTKALVSSKPINAPTLTNNITIQQPLVKKTGSSSPVNMMAAVAAKMAYSPVTSNAMLRSIESLIGIRYHYGSAGPNRYDCSGFVWKVFSDIGIDFERTSARSMWEQFEPVTGEDRYKFGTLVFFNNLGHVGIVADSEGFYQASSSKGITYSKFEGYWEKRIVGFRKVPSSK